MEYKNEINKLLADVSNEKFLEHVYKFIKAAKERYNTGRI